MTSRRRKCVHANMPTRICRRRTQYAANRQLVRMATPTEVATEMETITVAVRAVCIAVRAPAARTAAPYTSLCSDVPVPATALRLLLEQPRPTPLSVAMCLCVRYACDCRTRTRGRLGLIPSTSTELAALCSQGTSPPPGCRSRCPWCERRRRNSGAKITKSGTTASTARKSA